MTGVASFHLVRERPGRSLMAVARLGLDRPGLRRTDGLVFWRLLGTGRGSDTGPGADLRRTALFAVWRDRYALDAFEDRMSARWSRAEESYHVRLAGIRSRGSWRGFDPVNEIEAAPAEAVEGPVAVLTRAVVRTRHWRRFAAAGPSVSAELHHAAGLLAVCGIGEAPVGRQATFSMWRSGADALAFARDMPGHRAVVERTRAEGWYTEELFATFSPIGARGSWDGKDPLVALPDIG
jgi:hypothetical protein